MREWMKIIEDRADTEHAVSLRDIIQHFKDRYGVDITDINSTSDHFYKWCRANKIPEDGANGSKEIYARYSSDPDGAASCPPYFNFNHFCLDVGKDIPWQFNGETRWKIVPLPTGEEASRRAERQMDLQARIIAAAKLGNHIEGNDYHSLALPSLGDEAIDILKKISADFGSRVGVLLSIDFSLCWWYFPSFR